MRILLANPRGFCAGVDRAIDIVERAIELFGAPIYVRHEVVHNRFVVDRLRGLGAVFVEELDEVPADATVIFSAHGVSKAVQAEAGRRGLRVFDATCPLVTKVHMEVTRYAREGRDVILIGHQGHPEVEGTMGQFDESQGGRISLVETVAGRRRHADHALRGRHRRRAGRAAASLPDPAHAAQGGHLLRDAESPGRGEEACRGLRRRDRRRLT
jgi:(E)-4-hydroxy-3-methyl-but-2-enyl pyrophosphate reductase